MSLLRDLGIVSLDPATPTDQANIIETGDLQSVAVAMTAAFQEAFADEHGELRTQPGAAYIFAPTAVTLTATLGSTTVSAFTTFASWMLGCTIRINGDSQDNEVLSSTKLARPYAGTTGTGITATVYCDAVTLDGTVSRVVSPMFQSDGTEVIEVTSRRAFLVNGGYSIPNWDQFPVWYWRQPFYNFSQKPIGPPLVFFLDGYLDASLDYVPRRIRLSPMPGVSQTISYTATVNPPRVVAADIDGAAHADPGVKIPMVNSWVESVFLPIARQINMANPRFKNDGIRQEISRQYAMAKRRLTNANASTAPVETVYY